MCITTAKGLIWKPITASIEFLREKKVYVYIINCIPVCTSLIILCYYSDLLNHNAIPEGIKSCLQLNLALVIAVDNSQDCLQTYNQDMGRLHKFSPLAIVAVAQIICVLCTLTTGQMGIVYLHMTLLLQIFFFFVNSAITKIPIKH